MLPQYEEDAAELARRHGLDGVSHVILDLSPVTRVGAVGGAFFGESMFSLVPEASRAALAALDARLAACGFVLLDGQLPHEGLAGYGFRTVPRAAFLRDLAVAVAVLPPVNAWENP